LKEKLYGNATTDAAMAIDDEPTMDPKLLKKLISDEVRAAVRAAAKNDKRPTKAGKQKQPHNNTRNVSRKDDSDDDKTTTNTPKTSKWNNKKKASPANTITPTKEAQIYSGINDQHLVKNEKCMQRRRRKSQRQKQRFARR
jgi:hypothetical protein